MNFIRNAFLIGPAPIRRTEKYLEAGRLILNEDIRVMLVHYNVIGDHHAGIRQFAFWRLCQIQYKNPNVLVNSLPNMFPNPFMRFWYNDGSEILVDCDSKSEEEIMDHLIQVVGRSKILLKREFEAKSSNDARDPTKNSSLIGVGCGRACHCNILGQVPCPKVVQLPNHMVRGNRVE